MNQFTLSTINLGLVSLMGFFPQPERIADVLPYVQLSAFTAIAVNNSLQVVKGIKKTKG